jgi:hypothetical protein
MKNHIRLENPSTQEISTPLTMLKGWCISENNNFSFSVEVNGELVSPTLIDRPDVQKIYPEYKSFGFNLLIDNNLYLKDAIKNITITIKLNSLIERRSFTISDMCLSKIKDHEVNNVSRYSRVAMNQKYLFICGCPRSGTSAIVKLLNSHPSIAIGMERYKFYAKDNMIGNINEEAFKSENFFAIKEYQTNIVWKDFYDSLKPKFTNDLLMIGDKYPQYYNFYEKIANNFPDAQWIFMVRDILDVAASYNARALNEKDNWPENANYLRAVAHWNNSLAKTWKYIKANENRKKVFICNYEKIFSGDTHYFNSLISFLEIDIVDEIRECYDFLTKDWNIRNVKNKKLKNEELEYIQKHANYKLKEFLLHL